MFFGSNIDWFPIKLSFAVASAATLIALFAGSGLAWLLARKRFPGRDLVDSLITLPLVLPPTVLGYYLLVVLGTRSSLGGFLYHRFGIRLTFTVGAAIIAATIHALPLVTKSLRAAFEGVDTELEAAARTLGLSGRLDFFSGDATARLAGRTRRHRTRFCARARRLRCHHHDCRKHTRPYSDCFSGNLRRCAGRTR